MYKLSYIFHNFCEKCGKCTYLKFRYQHCDVCQKCVQYHLFKHCTSCNKCIIRNFFNVNDKNMQQLSNKIILNAKFTFANINVLSYNNIRVLS